MFNYGKNYNFNPNPFSEDWHMVTNCVQILTLVKRKKSFKHANIYILNRFLFKKIRFIIFILYFIINFSLKKVQKTILPLILLKCGLVLYLISYKFRVSNNINYLLLALLLRHFLSVVKNNNWQLIAYNLIVYNPKF